MVYSSIRKILLFLFCISSGHIYSNEMEAIDRLYFNFLSTIAFSEDGPTCGVSKAAKDPCSDSQNLVIAALCATGLKVKNAESNISVFGKQFNLDKSLNVGDNTSPFMDQLVSSQYVFILFTKRFKERSTDPSSGASYEISKLMARLSADPSAISVINGFLLDGRTEESVPDCLADHLYADTTVEGKFNKTLFYTWYLDVLAQKIMPAKKEIINQFKASVLNFIKKNTTHNFVFSGFFNQTFFQRRYINALDYVTCIRNNLCNHHIFMIEGFPGIGKTTLAKLYAKDALSIGWYDLAFFLECESENAYQKSINSLYDFFIKLYPQFDDSITLKERIFFLQRHLFCRDRTILLVFDNVSDQSDYENWIRPLINDQDGHFLITSRKLESVRDVARLEGFSTQESITYLEKYFLEKRYTYTDRSCLERVALCVENLPLAVAQIANYIAGQFPKISLDSFLERFRNKQNEILQQENDSNNAFKVEHISAYITYCLCREALSDDAQHLLDLFCFLHAENIPYILFRYFFTTEFNKRLKNSWCNLKQSGLVEDYGEDLMYCAKIHRLFQSIGRLEAMENSNEFARIQKNFWESNRKFEMYIEDETIVSLKQKIAFYNLLEFIILQVETFRKYLPGEQEEASVDFGSEGFSTLRDKIFLSIKKDPSCILLENETTLQPPVSEVNSYTMDMLARQFLRISKDDYQTIKTLASNFGFSSIELDDVIDTIAFLRPIISDKSLQDIMFNFSVEFLKRKIPDNERLRCLTGVVELHNFLKDGRRCPINLRLMWSLNQKPYNYTFSYAEDGFDQECFATALWSYIYAFIIEQHQQGRYISITLSTVLDHLQANECDDFLDDKYFIIQDILDDAQMHYDDLKQLLKVDFSRFTTKENWDDVFMHIRKLPLRRFTSDTIKGIIFRLFTCSKEKRREIGNLFYIITEYMYRDPVFIINFIELLKRTEDVTYKFTVLKKVILPTMAPADFEQLLIFFARDTEQKLLFLKQNPLDQFPRPDKHFSGCAIRHLLQLRYNNQQQIDNVNNVARNLYKFNNFDMNDHSCGLIIESIFNIPMAEREDIIKYVLEIIDHNPDRENISLNRIETLIGYFGRHEKSARFALKENILESIKTESYERVVLNIC
ncbi:MAG TPA: hypothetical protein DIC42_03530 [Holosporales bacterium]|nr:hypothetical protein [Holosporales bacterium]